MTSLELAEIGGGLSFMTERQMGEVKKRMTTPAVALVRNGGRFAWTRNGTTYRRLHLKAGERIKLYDWRRNETKSV